MEHLRRHHQPKALNQSRHRFVRRNVDRHAFRSQQAGCHFCRGGISIRGELVPSFAQVLVLFLLCIEEGLHGLLQLLDQLRIHVFVVVRYVQDIDAFAHHESGELSHQT